MKSVSKEIAIDEINKFLDYKKIKVSVREQHEADINILVEAVEDGSLTLRDDFHLEYTLEFPIKDDNGNTHTSKIVCKPRLRVSEIDDAMVGVNMKKPMEIIRAYASAVTGLSKGIIGKLDTVDSKVISSISGFFM